MLPVVLMTNLTSDLYIKVNQHLTELCTTLQSLSHNNCVNENPLTDNTYERTSSKLMQSIKNHIIHFWNNKNLNPENFLSGIRLIFNYKAEIYENWLNSTPLILDRKFQIKRAGPTKPIKGKASTGKI